MSKVRNLIGYNNRGSSLLLDENSTEHYEEWKNQHPGEVVFGPIIKYIWQADNRNHELQTPRNDGLWILPDASGFLLCENVKRSDNLLLLDAYGKERMRLDVPWRMTGATEPECGQYPTGFIGPTTPYPNPATGEEGKFGAKAYVEGFYGLAFYFELDYHTGEFLWCYRLERG